jgi:hypothetical protein
VANYLQRNLFPTFEHHLALEGWLIYEHPTVRNLERNPSPSRRFLLDEGELGELVTGHTVILREEWVNGRHLAQLAKRR